MKSFDFQREEWDFSACIDEERNTCLHYEYAREYVRTRPEIEQKLRDLSRVKLAIKLINARYTKYQPRSYILPILSSRFPATPWLKVPREERQYLIDLCDPQPGEGPNPDLLTDARWELSCLQNFDEMRRRQAEELRRQGNEWIKTSGYVDGKKVSFDKIALKMFASTSLTALASRHFYAYTGPTNYALITLDWRRSNNDLKHSFEQLLARRPKAYPDSGASTAHAGRTESIITPVRRGGRGGPHDKFNQLAALRLLNHYVDSKKIEDFLAEKRFGFPYSNIVNARIAARKVRATLRKMEEEGQFAGFAVRA